MPVHEPNEGGSILWSWDHFLRQSQESELKQELPGQTFFFFFFKGKGFIESNEEIKFLLNTNTMETVKTISFELNVGCQILSVKKIK